MRPDEKLDVQAILADLETYRPRRRGWHWRRPLAPGTRLGPFVYQQLGEGLARSLPLPAAKYFEQIDPQPDLVLTTEIASGRFEDDLRRMRMAAWAGADHIMVIRNTGQSHIEGLLEGTPEGVGGVPITRKQLRATRKALDLIEDEVGRPINLHSYVSGVSGPEVAVLFVEEGVNGAHQDPQYNILYRNVNMVRSFVDAGVAKALLAWAEMIQIDGAHNANATAREAWKVYPELFVQHAINSRFSERVGLKPEQICLSTVPPTAPPAPALRLDLPYAVALRFLFDRYKFRAQMNTRYMESSTREATVTHVLNLLISRLTSADIQSTITPDEGRNVPWHYYNVAALQTARQTLAGLDGLSELVELKKEGELAERSRELIERAVLFLEELIEVGGYFEGVRRGFFVDSALYPERRGDGIARDPAGGVGADTVVARHPNYFAPVCVHYGYNNTALAEEFGPLGDELCTCIGGCTLHHPEKIVYIDELDENDHVGRRLAEAADHQLKPEVQWAGDGTILLTLFLPAELRLAEAAALAIGQRLGLSDCEVVHKEVLHPAEGTLLELKATVPFGIDPASLELPDPPAVLDEGAIRAAIEAEPLKVVAATVGEDEHSVGLREILDLKHGGLEKFGIECHYLGTSVPIDKLVDAAIELDADAILISTIISHADIHYRNMRLLDSVCREKGVRERFLLVAGGTQVTPELARAAGMDQGFGRGTRGLEVASFLVQAWQGVMGDAPGSLGR